MAWLIESKPARPAARRKRSTITRPSGVKTGMASNRLFRPRVTSTHSPSASAASTAARSSASLVRSTCTRALPRSTRACTTTERAPTRSPSSMARSAQTMASSVWSCSISDWAMVAIARARRSPGGRRPISSSSRRPLDDDGVGPAHLVVQAEPPAQRGGLLLDVAVLAGRRQPAVRVAEGLGVERHQPRRLGRHREEDGIVRRLAQRVGGEPQRLEGGSLGQVVLGRVPGEGHELLEPARARRVASHRREVVAAGRAQPLERPLVEQAALAAEQLALHLVADERVAEAEAVVVGLDQEVGVDQPAQHLEQGVLGHVGGPGERLEPRGRPADGGGLEHPALRRRQPLELAADGFLERPREAGGQQVAGAALPAAGGSDDLLDQERVAAGAGGDGLDDGRGRRRRVDGGDQRAHVVAVQAVQADLLDGVPALQAEQQVAAGEATAEVVRPVGADQQEARAGAAGRGGR